MAKETLSIQFAHLGNPYVMSWDELGWVLLRQFVHKLFDLALSISNMYPQSMNSWALKCCCVCYASCRFQVTVYSLFQFSALLGLSEQATSFQWLKQRVKVDISSPFPQECVIWERPSAFPLQLSLQIHIFKHNRHLLLNIAQTDMYSWTFINKLMG